MDILGPTDSALAVSILIVIITVAVNVGIYLIYEEIQARRWLRKREAKL